MGRGRGNILWFLKTRNLPALKKERGGGEGPPLEEEDEEEEAKVGGFLRENASGRGKKNPLISGADLTSGGGGVGVGSGQDEEKRGRSGVSSTFFWRETPMNFCMICLE